MIEVIINRVDNCPLSNNLILKLVRYASKQEPKISGIMEITFLSNAQIKKINHTRRGINHPTDVLSFAFKEDKMMTSPMLGELYLSYKYILMQAKRFRVSAREETIRMITHGLLHLCGHDHIKNSQAKKMFTLQEKIVSKIAK